MEGISVYGVASPFLCVGFLFDAVFFLCGRKCNGYNYVLCYGLGGFDAVHASFRSLEGVFLLCLFLGCMKYR